jgi:methylenetetrahydrofolate reductase (NADPH)
MQKGNIPGCVVSDELINRLKKEKKPQRLERAALMVAAVKSLGFAGAHIGGFGLKYRDVMHIIETADIIGEAWKDRLDELIMAYPDEWYLFPEGPDGFSDPDGPYQVDSIDDKMPWVQNMCLAANRMFIDDNSVGAHFLQNRLGVDEKPPEGDNWRHGFWYSILRQARTYKKYHLGCVGCGDCIQDHMTYAGCSMGRCYKELRNGPCGGSRPDGTCEVDAEKPCVWTLAYQYTLAATQDPRKFATTLIPPRDWTLNRTNSLANRLADIDNHHRRKTLEIPFPELSAENTMLEGDNDACHRRTD